MGSGTGGAMNFAQAQIDTDDQLVHVQHIEADQVRRRWPGVELMVERAMEHSFSDTTTDDILARLVDGSLMMIVITREERPISVMCLEFVERLSGRTCHCMILAGESMETWIDQWMVTWWQVAADYGCDKISIKGRPGWARYAKRRYGFKHQYTVMSLDIERSE